MSSIIRNSLRWGSIAAALVLAPAIGFAAGPLQITTIAGTPGQTGASDGAGAAASFGGAVLNIAVDSNGNTFVADYYNSCIRKVTPAGVVTTIAGAAGAFGYVDGPGALARFYYPTGIAVDSQNAVYVTDIQGYTIRKLTPQPDGSYMVSTFAGVPNNYGYVDGPASSARFSDIRGLTFDPNGNLYVVEADCNTIRKISPEGMVSTFAGPGASGEEGDSDGTGSAARFNFPEGLSSDAAGNIYVADSYNSLIRKITPQGVVSTVAGQSGVEGSADGIGIGAQFARPCGVASDPNGNLYVADLRNLTIRYIDTNRQVTTIAGTPGVIGSADGLGSAASFNYTWAIALTREGYVRTMTDIDGTLRGGGPTPTVTSSVVDNVAVINSPNYGVLRLNRNGDVAAPLTVWYWWAGTASPWNDYRYVATDTVIDHMTIPAGQSSLDLVFKAVGGQDGSTGGVQVVTRDGYTAGTPDTATFGIYVTDPNSTPVVTVTTIDDTAVTNTPDNAVLRLARTGNTGAPLTVWWWWAGTATAWDDYRFADTDSVTDHITIPAGQSTLDLVFKSVSNHNATAGIQVVTRDGYTSGYPDTALFNLYPAAPSGPAAPTFDPAGGSFAAPVSVQLQSATSGATINYTLDGSTATTNSPVYSSPISISSGTVTIHAIATLNGASSSQVSATFTISGSVATPTINPSSGTYPAPLSVSIQCATNGAVIHYTTDGSPPSAASPTYTQPFTLNQSATVSAVAVAPNMPNSATETATYSLTSSGGTNQVVATPIPGSYATLQLVTLRTSQAGWQIYYTTDGSNPSNASIPYSEPISVGNGTTTIKAIAYNGSSTTPIAMLTYAIPGSPTDTTDTNTLGLPPIGAETAKVLTPNIVELKFINTIGDIPGHAYPANASFSEPAEWGSWFSDTPTMLNGDWYYVKSFSPPSTSLFPLTVNGTTYVPTLLGAKRRARFANFTGSDLRIENSLYLQYGVNLEGQAATISDNSRGATGQTVVTDPYRLSPAIHVNQEGYPVSLSIMPAGTPTPKRARVGYYMGTGGDAPNHMELNLADNAPFKIVDANNHANVVFNGSLNRVTEIGLPINGYQSVFEANFDALTTPGIYQLVVPGLGASLPFRIDDRMLMGVKRTYALGLYAQRCGTGNDFPITRFTHGACHTELVRIPWDTATGASPWGAQGGVWDTLEHECIARVNQQGDGWNSPQQTAPSFTRDPSTQRTHFLGGLPITHTIYDDNPDLRTTYPVAGYKNSAGDTNPDINVDLYSQSGTTIYVRTSGGHHDAGDYSKYMINSADLVHYLMASVDYIPGGTAKNLGFPESDGSAPDLLREAKWEADFISSMQDPSDGGFYALVYPDNGAATEAGPPDHYQRDSIGQIVWPKGSGVTASAVAALAQCASSNAFRSAYGTDAANKYARQAVAGWRFLKNLFQANGGNIMVPSSCVNAYQMLYFYGDEWCHNDEVAWAAAELYLLTGDQEYKQALLAWMPDPTNAQATYHYGWDPMAMRWGNAIRSIALAAGASSTAQPYRHVGQIGSDLGSTYVSQCRSEALKKADMLTDDSLGNADGTVRNAYGTSMANNEKIPAGFGWYFSTSRAADIAVGYALLQPGQAPADAQRQPRYITAMMNNVNYELGVNPLNLSYVAGLGQRRPREFVNQYEEAGPRALPPTGIPISNIGHPYERSWWTYGYVFDRLTYPEDHPIDGSDAFAFYDRFTDANNTGNELVTVNIARSMMTLSLLASGTTANSDPRNLAADTIHVSQQPATTTTPARLVVDSASAALGGGTESLAEARIVWELENAGVFIGPSVDLTGPAASSTWYEVEAAWPDGKRTVAKGTLTPAQTTTLWVDESRPGTYATGDEPWTWTANPTPASGASCHVSPAAAGEHGHGFADATGLTFNGGDTLFTHVYIDPANRPSEIMVIWTTTAGTYVAYWNGQSGPMIIDQSQYATAATREGPVPTQSGWVRLEMPTSASLGSDVQVLKMDFYHYDGGLWWDAAGKYTP